ncbi:ribonuclease HII [Candidatus Dojkabacteria bacterium]|nr:ribonuclease HII [Candidatus Dojkabacteria bacterium]
MSQKFLSPNQEIKLISKDYDMVVGVDEAGRGPWAGPVAVGFYGFVKGFDIVEGVADSKTLNPKSRKNLFPQLLKYEDAFCLLGEPDQIDKSGISRTIEQLIQQGIDKISASKKNYRILFLIDGYFKQEFNADFELIKKGDSKYYSIAAASIIAKETRDNLMLKYSEQFPNYGFDKHVGYGTKLHKQMIQKYGLCEIHRRSFKPVKDLL